MTSPSLPMLLLSATLSLSLSYDLPYGGDAPPSDYAPAKTFSSWGNTPFQFRHHDQRSAPSRYLSDVDDADLGHFARSLRSNRSLISLLLWPHLTPGLDVPAVSVSQKEKSKYVRGARGMKRKMFWSPLGYMPHRDIEESDKVKGSGSAGQGAALFRYG